MDRKQQVLDTIIESGVIAVIRADRSEELTEVADALVQGGLVALEVTMTTPGAMDVIKAVAAEMGSKVIMGAGTVLDPETARAVILAGAEYIVTPTLNPATIEMAKRYGKVMISGAFTPTEILTAWECGSDIVKVFPATAVGPKYLKDIKGPLPHIRLSPTGGVDLSNAGEFIRCGACCIAVGGNLVPKKAIADRDWATITENARRFIEEVRKARS
ncbi:MAG TPA: bifunctional 4-hydroxy-2-oxoglutarate aldolase/2-dehydro-3-deoxy-phosphogluconate aldolase [bacterium]|nr:bifunctional 4-hydroxy-2-oxoglutarate aldolase/2-dehydro-3-deoxy-phosphogluconate aldolase [bacterium]HQL63371.1 bifunctional 4-hydroxy-2-oxoglutarate aldolase/2-dehydro-3-deoxy-phosphogluconate aldolase [bacterium]